MKYGWWYKVVRKITQEKFRGLEGCMCQHKDTNKQWAAVFDNHLEQQQLHWQCGKVISTTINSLLISVNEFTMLEHGPNTHLTELQDKAILRHIQQHSGVANSDAKHMAFVSESQFGHGIMSTSTQMLKAIVWELEVQVNEKDLQGKTIRASLKAQLIAKHKHKDSKTFIDSVIGYLAQHGIYGHDLHALGIKYALEASYRLAQDGVLSRQFNPPLGVNGYKGFNKSGTMLGHVHSNG